MDFLEFVRSPRRLTLIQTGVCLLCNERKNVREIWYCNDRLYGHILCYDCCSFEDGEKISKYWLNMNRMVSIDIGYTSLVEYLKNTGKKFRIRRSNGEIDDGWEVRWYNLTDNFFSIKNESLLIKMINRDGNIEKYVDFVELIELNIEIFRELSLQNIKIKNWLICGDNEERNFFEDVKNWEKSFSIFMQNINSNWKNIWDYEEKIFE